MSGYVEDIGDEQSGIAQSIMAEGARFLCSGFLCWGFLYLGFLCLSFLCDGVSFPWVMCTSISLLGSAGVGVSRGLGVIGVI